MEHGVAVRADGHEVAEWIDVPLPIARRNRVEVMDVTVPLAPGSINVSEVHPANGTR